MGRVARHIRWGRQAKLFAVVMVAAVAGSAALASAALGAPDRMIYIKDFELFRAETWGGVHEQLTSRANGAPLAYAAAFSPDGQRVVFNDGVGNLWLLDIYSGSLRTLYTSSTAKPARPKFHPNGRKVIFMVGDANTGDIYTVNVDGTALTRVIGWKDGQDDPDFSPSGSHIVFTSRSNPKGSRLLNSQNQLFIANADGTSPRQVTQYGTGHNGAHAPAFSPDGTKLAFAGLVLYGNAQQGDIFTIDTSGANQRQLTSQNTSSEWSPTWSPDGAGIAFSTNREQINMGGYYDIYSVPSTGGAAVSLINVPMPQSASSPSYRHPSTTTDALDYAAAEHKPLLMFDEEERWRPVEINRFIGETHYVCQPGVACQVISTPADLRRFPNGAWIDIEGSGGEANYRSPAAECNVNGLQECDSGNRSAIYYHVSQPSPLTYRYLDYWWFYRYNNVTDGFGDHEGDWEGVSIAPSSTNPYTFDFASFSQHGPFYSYLRDNLSCDGGSQGSCGTESARTGRRVHVYPANGSHANYPDTCRAPEPCTHSNSLVPEFDHGGERPWGNNNDSLALVEFPAARPLQTSAWTTGPQEWVDWPGRWGASGTNGDGSPRSPGNQDHFWTPWVSDCTDGSDCAFQGKRVAREDPATERTRSVKSCAGWFGAGVAALACDAGLLRTAVDRRRIGRRGQFKIRLAGRRAASAPGLAQLLGPPLEPGQRLVVEGRGGAATQLRLRVRSGRKVYDVTFSSVKLSRRTGRAVVKIPAPGTSPTKGGAALPRLVQPDGTRARPTVTGTGASPRR